MRQSSNAIEEPAKGVDLAMSGGDADCAALNGTVDFELSDESSVLEARSNPVNGPELSGELSWQDLVKFAKAEPGAEDCERAIDRAASLVDRTRAVVEMPERRAAAGGAP